MAAARRALPVGALARRGAPERGEWARAADTLEDVLGLGDDELVHGLLHLAAAGWRAEDGDRERARKQLEHARRRLGPYLPEQEEVDLAALIELVRRAGRVVESRPMAESWRNRKTLILSRTDMMGLLTPAEYVDCVEHAFRMHGLGRVYMEPKGHIVLDRYQGEWEVMPSYIEEPEAAACKWVSIREDNAKYELPAVFSILDLHAPGDGLSARDLRRLVPHAHAYGRLGGRLGEVARAEGLVRARDPRDRLGRRGNTRDVRHGLRMAGRSYLEPDTGVRRPLPRRAGAALPALKLQGTTDVRTAVEGADVIVTGTHARGWIVDDDWVKGGAHIAALGADLKGEQELDPRTLQRGRVFVDDIRQCREDGEINVALSEGLIAEEDVAGEIGKVIAGELEGRQSDDQVTVFDSTGIALQDSATVPLEYDRAVAAGVGVEKKMIST